jgi:hypothetical protein
MVTMNRDDYNIDRKTITGWETEAEERAYLKGRDDEERVLIDFIKNWNGNTNSHMGQLLHDKINMKITKHDMVECPSCRGFKIKLNQSPAGQQERCDECNGAGFIIT